VQRLDFPIPPFLSIAWVSDAAREHWRPIFKQVNRVLVDTTLSGVATGLWESRRIRLPGAIVLRLPEAAKALGLSLRTWQTGRAGEKGPVFHDVVVQQHALGDCTETSGVPACCRLRLADMRESARRESIWESALATPGHRHDGDTISVPAGYCFGALWHKLLVDPFSYPLCHLGCPATLAQTRRHLDWMREAGHDEEAESIEEIAGWPVEWNVCHGICELRTPIVKIAYETDATDRRYRVQVEGTASPADGAHGLVFPYRARARLRVADSRSFRDGMDHGSGSGER
jgi:hypothetical protein